MVKALVVGSRGNNRGSLSVDAGDLAKIRCARDRAVFECAASREVVGKLLLVEVSLILTLEFLLGHLWLFLQADLQSGLTAAHGVSLVR